MNDQRDQQLEELMASLRDVKPTDAQMQRWQNAVTEARLGSNSKSRRLWSELIKIAAAACIGFAIGAYFFKTKTTKEVESYSIEENNDEGATVLYLTAKSE